MSESDSGFIRLNVGGSIFHTFLSTLQFEPDSSLAAMFSNPGMLPRTDQTGAYVFDASPEYFSVILNWCRYNKLMVGPHTDLTGLEAVADFFGMLGLVQAVKARQDQEKKMKEDKERIAVERHLEIVTKMDGIMEQIRTSQDRTPTRDPRYHPRNPRPFPFPDPDIEPFDE